MTIKERVIGIIELRTIYPGDVLPEQTINSLDADSLDLVEVIMDIEDEYGIEISDDEAWKCKTVADLIRLVEGKVSQK